MGTECAYSFWDLYEASEGKKADNKFRQVFAQLPQVERNTLVKKWSKKAGWETEDRLGTDGKMYTAFCPIFK